SRTFRFHLDLLAEAPVAFGGLLGQPAWLRIDLPGCPRRRKSPTRVDVAELGVAVGVVGPLARLAIALEAVAQFGEELSQLLPALPRSSRRRSAGDASPPHTAAPGPPAVG